MEIDSIKDKSSLIQEERTYSKESFYQEESLPDPKAIVRISQSAGRKAKKKALSQANIANILQPTGVAALPAGAQEIAEKKAIVGDPKLKELTKGEEVLNIELFQFLGDEPKKIYHAYTDSYIIVVDLQYIQLEEPTCGPAKFELKFNSISNPDQENINNTPQKNAVLTFPPWLQEKVEKKAIENDPKLREIIGDEEILGIELFQLAGDESEKIYHVYTDSYIVAVNLKYIKNSICGPQKFELEFNGLVKTN